MTATLDVPVLLGRTEPRIFTPPLRPLTPASTLGFEAIRFARDVAKLDLLPWQEWLFKAMLELRPDGGFRFQRLLILIGRQNGKTTFAKVLALYLMFMGKAQLVLGAAQSLDIAREAWSGAVEIATDVDDLAAEVETVRYANGEQCLTLVSGARYRITAATRSAGRGLSVDALLLDELREHRTWDAWSALSKTTTARPNALIVGISNAGDDQSCVLNSLRSTAIAETDPTLGIFEWSAPDGCDLDDVQAWAQANPGLGRTVSEQAIRSAMMTDPATVFRTETLCMRVDALDAALDLASWKACSDPSGSLASVRSRVAACVDVAPDGAHCTVAGAAVLDDGRVRVEVLAAWTSTAAARRELPALLARIAPAAVGWFPSGPAAELGAEMRALDALEIKGSEVTTTCMSFAGLVTARRILHSGDPLLDAHIAGTSKLRVADGWRFARKGVGHVDAVYAAAGAVEIARTLPAPVKAPRSKVF